MCLVLKPLSNLVKTHQKHILLGNGRMKLLEELKEVDEVKELEEVETKEVDEVEEVEEPTDLLTKGR